MGCKCCASEVAYNQLAPDEEEIVNKKKYKSGLDKTVEPLEKDNMLLGYIPLIDYINILDRFSIEDATLPFDGPLRSKFSSKDEFLHLNMPYEVFQSFLENKILKHKNVYEVISKNSQAGNIFKAALLEIYKNLNLKLEQNSMQQNNFIMKKRNILALGMIYCLSNNVGKIKLLFDLFANDKGVIVKGDEEFNEFLLSMFLVSGFCMLSARFKLPKQYKELTSLKPEELINNLQNYELKDSQKLVEYTNNVIFEGKKQINYNEFKVRFGQENGLLWLFDPKGIREIQEKYGQAK